MRPSTLPSTYCSETMTCSRFSATDQRSAAGRYSSCSRDSRCTARIRRSRLRSSPFKANARSVGVTSLLPVYCEPPQVTPIYRRLSGWTADTILGFGSLRDVQSGRSVDGTALVSLFGPQCHHRIDTGRAPYRKIRSTKRRDSQQDARPCEHTDIGRRHAEQEVGEHAGDR